MPCSIKKKTNLSYLPCIGEKIFKYKQSSDWFCKKGNKRLRYSSRPLGIFSNAAVSFNIFGSRCGHTGLNLSAILIPSQGSAARVGANLERTIIKWENYCLKKNSQHESNNKKNYITRQRPVWVTWSCDGNFTFYIWFSFSLFYYYRIILTVRMNSFLFIFVYITLDGVFLSLLKCFEITKFMHCSNDSDSIERIKNIHRENVGLDR